MRFPAQNFPQSFQLQQPERIQTSLADTDDSTRKTVAAMARHIKQAQTDPWFLGVAHNITRSRELLDKVQGVFHFCKAVLRFKKDEQSVFDLYGETNQVDFLIEPRAIVRMMPQAYGDCDEFTMFSLALLTALGVPCEIVTVACDRGRPGYWSHVYGQVILPDGRRMALDCSPAGRFPGWEVPDMDVQRRGVWDLEGNEVYGAPAASRDLRMHAYIPRRRANRGRRGMGFEDEAGQTVDIGASAGDIGSTPAGMAIDPITGALVRISSGGATGGVPSVGSTGSGFNWNTLIGNLTSLGGKLGTIALTPRGGYVATGPGGQTIVSNTGLPVSVASLTSGAGGSLLLWAGIGIAVIAALKAAASK